MQKFEVKIQDASNTFTGGFREFLAIVLDS